MREKRSSRARSFGRCASSIETASIAASSSPSASADTPPGEPWVVLGIEPVGVAAADVHHPLGAGRHLVEAALEMLETEGQRVLDPAREHRLVDLDHRAAGLGEAADLDVQRVGEGRAALRGSR